jgi:hypothetical protein
MVGVGTLLMALSVLGLFLRWRGTLFEKRWLKGGVRGRGVRRGSAFR